MVLPVRPPHPAAQGFTLAELLAAMAIAAVLATLGAASFRSQLAGAALAGSTSRTLAALHWARHTALATGRTVTVCPSADGRRCAYGTRQWIAFANDADGSQARREADEPLLQRWEMPAGVSVTGTRGHASFLPRVGAASTVTFEFCHPAAPSRSRSIIVSQTGRARLVLPDPGGGGQPAACAN